MTGPLGLHAQFGRHGGDFEVANASSWRNSLIAASRKSISSFQYSSVSRQRWQCPMGLVFAEVGLGLVESAGMTVDLEHGYWVAQYIKQGTWTVPRT